MSPLPFLLIRPRILLLLALAATLLSQAFAEKADHAFDTNHRFVARTWRVQEGLPHNTVMAIAQTRDGFLWLGTVDGLARFDGVQFRRFGLADGLPSLSVRALLADRKGGLWIGTTNGISRLADGRFSTWTTRDGLAGTMIMSIAEDGAGAIWIGTPTGMSRWADGKMETLGEASGIGRRYVATLAVDPKGAVWASVNGLGLLRHEGGVFSAAGVPAANVPAYPVRMINDRAGNIWSGMAGAIHCLADGSWRNFGIDDGLSRVAVTSMAAGADGTLWVGTLDDGLFVLTDGKFHRLTKEDGLPDDGILAILEDREGNLWLGTRAEGLSRLRPRQAFLWRHSEEGAAIAPKTIAETPDGAIWVSSYGRGLYRFDPKAKEAFVRQSLPRLPEALASGAFLVGRDGSLWWGAGARLLHWKEGKLIGFSPDIADLKDDAVSSLCEDRDEGLWIGSRGGRLLLRRGGTVERFDDGMSRGVVRSLVQQRDGTLWIGSYGNGLSRLRLENGRAVERVRGLSSDLIRALLLDSRGILWIGTEGGGLNCLRDGTVRAFGPGQGVDDDTIVSLVEDAAGNLWLGSYRGITRLLRSDIDGLLSGKQARAHPRRFDHADGLLSAQCTTGFITALRTSSGLLLFSTEHGLVTIDPRTLKTGASAPDVLIDNLLIGGQPRPLAPSVNIPPGSRQIQIDYTALQFATPEHVRFRYRLSGLDSTWIEVGAKRSVEYSFLPPGRYRFEVTAHTGDGKWNPKTTSLTLVVLPHFWETWWFRTASWLAGVILTAGIGLVLLRRRHRLRLRELEREQAVERERARIARDMHDALGSRLTKAGMIAEALNREETSASPSRKNLFTLRHALEEITVTMDELVWAVNPKHDTLDSLANYLVRFTQEFFAGSTIRCELHIPTDLPSVPLTAAVRHNLFLAYQEALANAAKHAHPSAVAIRLDFAGDRLLLEVSDDGAGILSAEGRPGGRGLENMRHRLSDIGGRCNIDTAPQRGTRVTFELTLSQHPHVHGDSQAGKEVL